MEARFLSGQAGAEKIKIPITGHIKPA